MTARQERRGCGIMVTLLNSTAVMPANTLATLHPGDIATIVSIHAEEALHQRLLALGFRTGKQIEVIRKASFSGPLQVRIGTTDVMLRRSEAGKIKVSRP